MYALVTSIHESLLLFACTLPIPQHGARGLGSSDRIQSVGFPARQCPTRKDAEDNPREMESLGYGGKLERTGLEKKVVAVEKPYKVNSRAGFTTPPWRTRG